MWCCATMETLMSSQKMCHSLYKPYIRAGFQNIGSFNETAAVSAILMSCVGCDVRVTNMASHHMTSPNERMLILLSTVCPVIKIVDLNVCLFQHW